MLDARLRQVKEAVLRPIAREVGAAVSPTTVTLIGGGFALAAGAAAWIGNPLLGLALWLINRLLDGLDGTIARTHNKQSDFGGYLDILVDFVVYAFVPFGLVMAQPTVDRLIALVVMLGTFYVNAASWMYLAAILEARNQGAAERGESTTITMPVGLIEGTETVIFYCLFFLLPGALVTLYTLMAALVFVTIAQRIVWAARHL